METVNTQTKGKNEMKKTFAKNGNQLSGTQSVNLQQMKDGRFLVFARNFEDSWAILRTDSKTKAQKHFSSLVDGFTSQGYQEIKVA